MTENIPQFMNTLADGATKIAQHYFKQPIGVELKNDSSPVTIADKEIEMAMVERIRKAYPDHGILGEETARINPDSPMQWVIDPIDGTKAFIAGKPTFVTLIALCEDGVPIHGLISQPIQGKRWLGTSHSREGGNLPQPDPRLREDDTVNLAEAHIATTSIGYFNAGEATAFAKLEKATCTTLLNHDALAAGLLADGSIDILIEAKLKPYDFCAIVPVIEQAGGIVTDWNGRPVTMQSNGQILAAANKELHAQVLALL